MNLSPEKLQEANYELVDALDHLELIPFVKKYLNIKSKVSVFFYATNILLLIACVVSAYFGWTHKKISVGDLIFHFSLGFTFAFLLIPIHEGIHLFAYKYLGAKETSLDYNLKKFYFMALAHRFVVNRKEFAFVALLPFMLISALLIYLAVISNNAWQLSFLSTLLIHTAMCSGDFGLLNFFELHKHERIITYDDVKNKTSFFYKKQL